MKKILAMLLVLVMALGLVACGSSNTDTTNPGTLTGDTTETPGTSEDTTGAFGDKATEEEKANHEVDYEKTPMWKSSATVWVTAAGTAPCPSFPRARMCT